MARIHIIGLPHTLATWDYAWCAYQAKINRLFPMLASYGHNAIYYGPDVYMESVDQAAHEVVPVVFEKDRIEWFDAPEWDRTTVFHHWDPNHISWTTMNERAIAAIRERWQPGDIVGLIAGRCQQQIIDGLRDLVPKVVEWGIGYSGILQESCRVFESYAWMHHVAGLQHDDQVRYFDTVIPNCFDLSEFKFSRAQGEYLLFIGRPIAQKGLAVVQEITNRCGLPVKIAGQPGADIQGAEYVGIVTGDEKKELFAGAIATMVPTVYLEPFGGVAVESMLSGTPVITTDWGAFTETNKNGVSGYRCSTLADFLTAVDKVQLLNRGTVRQYAVERFSTEVGAEMYDKFFRRVQSLSGDGWYSL